MPGKANQSLAAPGEEGDGLIFPWKHRYRGLFWLWGFLGLSLLLHALGFYMFQVVYPSSGRLEPFPARVMILDEKNPANALLLQELNDRLVFLQPASTGTEGRKGMDDFSMAFQPSFVKRMPPFREPAALGTAPGKTAAGRAAVGKSSTRLRNLPPFRVEDHAAPSHPKAVPSTAEMEDRPAIRRRWTLLDDLSGLTMSPAQADGFNQALPPLGDGPEVVLDIIVDEAGLVKSVSVADGEDHPEIGLFIEAVKKQLKLVPPPGNGPVEGRLTIMK